MGRAISSDGATISYEIDGDPDLPPLLLINSIASTREMWARQIPAFTHHCRVIRYDARGHGRSSAPAGDYTLEQLGRDALAVLDDAGIQRAHVCGISLGGLTAQWLALHAAERVDALVLANTAARILSAEGWTERMALVQSAGMTPVADMSMQRWFSPVFHQRDRDTVRTFRAMVQGCPVDGYLGCCAAMRDADLRDQIERIAAPALLIASTADSATPPEALEFIGSRVKHARLVTLDSAHLSNVECADEFTAAVLDFLRPKA